jgi:YVTN family beta-propeller protein
VRNGSRPHASRLVALALLPLLSAAGASGAEALTKAYVVHTGANLVSVIDTATGTVVGTIPVGPGPTRVAVARDGSRAYVLNRDSASISVIDTASDAVVAIIPIGATPSGLAVTPDGRSLCVTTVNGVVEVVDTAAQAVVATISVGTSGGDIAITPDGSRAYVADGLVYVINTSTKTVVKSFAPETVSVAGIANNASSVAFSPDGARAYVGRTRSTRRCPPGSPPVAASCWWTRARSRLSVRSTSARCRARSS